VLSLIAEMPWSDSLVLRGSMLMCVFYGTAAREPADLDFVVLPESAVPVDSLDPHPYLAGFDVVQQWPEAADGAYRYDLWMDAEAEFETRGLRAIVPPDGLTWEVDACPRESFVDYSRDLAESVRRQPQAAPDVMLDADRVRSDDSWAYSYRGEGPGGIRVVIPWTAPDLPEGRVQIDLALDEPLPEPPVWTLIPAPRAAAGPLVVQAASRELSLAWKLLWLHTDSGTDAGPRPKDLYDAVLLAEDGRTRLSAKLLRRVMSPSAAGVGAENCDLDISAPGQADWSAFAADAPKLGARAVGGSAHEWLNRLSNALAATLPQLDTECCDRGFSRRRATAPGELTSSGGVDMFEHR
jgi:hypothetical protein